jgi:hypothetical protein
VNGVTLPPEDADEIPSPETWSSRRSDTDELDSGLPSGCHRCENPGGCDAEESMRARPGRGGGGTRASPTYLSALKVFI